MSTAPSQKLDEFGHIEAFPRRELAQGVGAGLTREERRTLNLRDSLPRGITIGFRSDGREKPWFVRFGKSRSVESFTTEKARNDRAHELAASVKGEGTATLDFDPAEWRKVQRFKERTGVTIEEAEEIVLRVRGNLRLNLTVTEAAARYLELRKSDGTPALSLIHPKLHLKRFVAAHGMLPLFAVTSEHVRDWLAKLKAEDFGPVTVRHHRKNLNVFFERALLEKWCVENPCRAVPPPRVHDQPTEILKPEEIFRLLKLNRERPVVGRLAFELYGFMRCSSVERLELAHLRMEAKGIEMPGAMHKSTKRKFRQGHAPVLWAWVKHAGAAAFEEITEKNYDDKKKAAFVRAGWEEVPHNRLRHSCASYALAETKNMPFVSYMMQHTSMKMTERYEGVAEESAAKLVLSMTPAAVALTWEQFAKRWNDFYQPFTSTTK
jgi:site-specific recombinase XerD